MTGSETLQAAVQERQVGLPGRYELKKMIRRGLWAEIGALFDFTPVFLDPPSPNATARQGGIIDWRCVPRRCYEILQGTGQGQTPVMPGHELWFAPKTRTKPKPVRMELKSKADMSRISDRERLYCAQSGQCHYCGEHTLFTSWTVEHRQPRARGGSGGLENKVGCCLGCNNAKGPLTEAEFLATDYMGGHLELKAEVSRVHEELRRQD